MGGPDRDDLRHRLAAGGHSVDCRHAKHAQAPITADGDCRFCGGQHRDDAVYQLCADDAGALSCRHVGWVIVGTAGGLCRTHGAAPSTRSCDCRSNGRHPAGPVAGCSGGHVPGGVDGLAHLLCDHERAGRAADALGASESAGLRRASSGKTTAVASGIPVTRRTFGVVRGAARRDGEFTVCDRSCW